jgi:3D (Asp-Asp-Asp) domain-containing protein
MKRLLIILMVGVMAGPSMFAREQSILARVTVYWPSGKGIERASSNGARLQNGHCAVDPSKIPFGSKVIFPDAACVAIDSGPAVTSRLAARKSGRTAAQRAALVIDRYFETRIQALAWAASHPHFMLVQVLHPGQSVDDRKPVKIATDDPPVVTPEQQAGSKPRPYAGNPVFSPTDVRSGLGSAVLGTVLPRS